MKTITFDGGRRATKQARFEKTFEACLNRPNSFIEVFGNNKLSGFAYWDLNNLKGKIQ